MLPGREAPLPEDFHLIFTAPQELFFTQLNEKNVTLLIVTHERRVSSVAKRVIAMRDGLIVEAHDEDHPGGGPA